MIRLYSRKSNWLGDKLKRLRQIKCMSEEKVGESIGKSRSAYAAYENNRSTPSPDTLLRLCMLFGVSPNEMLEWD